MKACRFTRKTLLHFGRGDENNMKWLSACLIVLFIVCGAYSSAKAGPITLEGSNSVFCFGAGGGVSMPVTICINCGEPNNADVWGAAFSLSPPTTGTYTMAFLAAPGDPALSLVSPSTIGNKTTFLVDPNAAQFTFSYFIDANSNKVWDSGEITYVRGPLQFVKFTQEYFGTSADPITKATALVHNDPNLSPPGFTDFNMPPGGTGIVTFDLGGGESLLAMFNTIQADPENGWNGWSAKSIIGGTLTPVPEPATMLLLGSGLIGLAGYGRKKFLKK
jgi:hypothetical protein